MSAVWRSYIYSHFHKKCTLADITKKKCVLLKKKGWGGGGGYWASKSAISVEKGVSFSSKNPRNGGVFQTWVRAWYTPWSGVGPRFTDSYICVTRPKWVKTRLFLLLAQHNNIEAIKQSKPRSNSPLWGKSTCDWWILLIKGQYCWMRFHTTKCRTYFILTPIFNKFFALWLLFKCPKTEGKKMCTICYMIKTMN